MEIDKAKVDEFTLALLYLTTFKEKHGQLRAWKGHDWDVLNRLYEGGYIDDPGEQGEISDTDGRGRGAVECCSSDARVPPDCGRSASSGFALGSECHETASYS